MKRISALNIDSPIGRLGLCARDGHLVRIVFGGTDETEEKDGVLYSAKKQLEEYFDGKRLFFDVPLTPEGTPFQNKVWDALMHIPYGETRSYADIAETVGSPKGFRAVGMANHVNPIPIIIPCHRVVGKSGKLVGYAGGLDMKTFLIELEKNNQAEKRTSAT